MTAKIRIAWAKTTLLLIVLAQIYAPQARADYSYWFPYAKAHDFMQENPFGAAASITITNGSFTVDTNGWNLGAGFVRHSSGYIDVGPNAIATLAQPRASMAVPWVQDSVHSITFTMTRAAGALQVGTDTDPDQYTFNFSGTYTVDIRVPNNTDGLVFTAVNFEGTIDDVKDPRLLVESLVDGKSNPVWKWSDLQSSGTQTYADRTVTQKVWSLNLHNSTGSAYNTGTNHVRLYIRDAESGQQVTTSTEWKHAGGSLVSSPLLKTTSLPSGISWVGAPDNYYRIDIGAMSSKVVNIEDVFQWYWPNPEQWPVPGTAFLSNTSFTSNASGWTMGTGVTWDSTLKKIKFDTAAGTLKQTRANMTNQWSSGQWYNVNFSVSDVTGSGSLNVGTNTIPSQAVTSISSANQYNIRVLADSHADGLIFTATGSGGQNFKARIDDITITPVASGQRFAATFEVKVIGGNYSDTTGGIDVQFSALDRYQTRSASTNYFESDVATPILPSNYYGIEEAKITPPSGKETCLIYPFFDEFYKANPFYRQHGRSMAVTVTNTDASADDIVVKVKSLDGTTVYTHTFANVAKGQTISFLPSQFYASTAAQDYKSGYIEIYGKRPASVALQQKYSRSGNESSGKGFLLLTWHHVVPKIQYRDPQ